jgi:ABC-type sugar transport system ATPase subunit
VYRHPVDLITSAITFSDPPLNTIGARKTGASVRARMAARRFRCRRSLARFADGPCTIGFRAHHLALKPQAADAAPLAAKVRVTEITGSESFVHLDHAGRGFVLLAHGIHPLDAGEEIEVWLDTAHIHLLRFLRQGCRSAARRKGGLTMARIDLDHIRHSYSANPAGDDDYALKEVNHSWDDGGAYALLGPSGCGKTTLAQHHLRPAQAQRGGDPVRRART